MISIQYEVTLPADYDMQIIRERVATKGHMTDAFPGLGLKAYLIREAGVDGSLVNQYAPFYLWNDADQATRFHVGGGGFQGILASFGRPVMHHWASVANYRGEAVQESPLFATKVRWSIPEDADLVAEIAIQAEKLRELSRSPGLHTAALALDLERWDLVRFALWSQAPADDSGQTFQVLHLSQPEQLREGVAWGK